MLELRGKIAECYVECFCRMFYLVFKDVISFQNVLNTINKGVNK